jgi:hypothetical protein
MPSPPSPCYCVDCPPSSPSSRLHCNPHHSTLLPHIAVTTPLPRFLLAACKAATLPGPFTAVPALAPSTKEPVLSTYLSVPEAPINFQRLAPALVPVLRLPARVHRQAAVVVDRARVGGFVPVPASSFVVVHRHCHQRHPCCHAYIDMPIRRICSASHSLRQPRSSLHYKCSKYCLRGKIFPFNFCLGRPPDQDPMTSHRRNNMRCATVQNTVHNGEYYSSGTVANAISRMYCGTESDSPTCQSTVKTGLKSSYDFTRLKSYDPNPCQPSPRAPRVRTLVEGHPRHTALLLDMKFLRLSAHMIHGTKRNTHGARICRGVVLSFC